MSGQYPGHSRPPVGTPPPQTVWNHLTMTQGSGLNIHPTALTNAVLNPANFYTHSSISRSSHLTSQLTPQLAHSQSAPTWYTPTAVPSSKPTSTTSSSSSSSTSSLATTTVTTTTTTTTTNSSVNPLFNLQAHIDNNCTNQNQYHRGSPNTLDLSTTSDIAENYSRMTQDIPISLTARNIDKSNRNGNIISPPIPLNGETSSDSGISSSVPTPNSLIEPVSLSTKDLLSSSSSSSLLTTPKILKVI
ncbi:hybrid signal transduction histidine kinase G-like [Aphidius gifuensis]|uniref:hybrid signal transduction histidine kinase G-like n=1 Tax=Aphidius gifuensis TaxID=684658 RepID=UPI001CDB8755|nr:hybrid signal transduction histidine kinase G-like [Aphidius gifuensis]